MIPSDPAPDAPVSDPTTTPLPPETPVESPPPVTAEAAPTADVPAPVAEAAPAEVLGPQTVPPPPALPAQPVPPVPPAPQPHDLSRIAQDLQIRKAQVEAVVQLLDDQNTVPFITRYRKERTGGLNEDVIRRIQERVAHLRSLADRKQTILKSIAFQGKLTDELVEAILTAEAPKRLEDLYLPYKTKKRSLATEAKEKGLEPLAQAIWNRDPAVANLGEVLPGMVDGWKQLHDVNDVLNGVKHILAEVIAETAGVRGPIRMFLWDTALLVAKKVENVPEGKGQEYRDYFDFKELVRQMPPHRVLAVNRGEKEQVIRARFEWDKDRVKDIALHNLPFADHPHFDLLQSVVEDAMERLLLPSLEREIRRELTEHAQDEAVKVFAKNLRSLLLQPPMRGKRVLAIDPGIRTGCKIAVLDETGKLLEDAVIYPIGQQKRAAEAKVKLEQLLRKYQISVIAIGNGTGCRETEQLVADLIGDLEQRRLNPTPVVSPDAPPSVTLTPDAATGSIVSDTIAPTISETMIAPPPADPSITSVPEAPVDAPMTITSEVHAPTPEAAGVATTETHPPAATSETVAPAVVPPPAAPASPPPPAISLEGLPPAPEDLAYVIVIEAGASDYSASPVAKEEFPTLDATTRGTISIGRRLQDPLAELVKIDPQHVGVGLYQHDVKAKELKHSLEAVIESCVNTVGVDLNTASVPLLRHVSGMNQLVAREVVDHRNRNGAFRSREQLKSVPQMGDVRFTQAAGFLKIPGGEDPLDTTWIHPESYAIARQILADLGFTPADLLDKAKLDELREKLNGFNIDEAAAKLNAGPPTIRDILDALAKPGRDPREDLPPPIFKKGILKIEDISPGMELKGTVLNVVPFGAFVDIGLKESGLVHISQMANRYIKSPYDVVAVGDVVNVWVIEVKAGEKKISLSMISPGTERRPPERRGFGGPPRGERGPGGPQQHGGPPQQSGEQRPPFAPRGERPAFSQRGPGGPGGGQGGGGRRFGGGAGRGPGGPGGRGPDRGPAPQQGEGAPASQAPNVQLPPPPPPRRTPPRPPKPLPNLTAEKKSGKSALNTFAELAAFFKTQDEPPKSGTPPAATPPADQPAASPETPPETPPTA